MARFPGNCFCAGVTNPEPMTANSAGRTAPWPADRTVNGPRTNPLEHEPSKRTGGLHQGRERVPDPKSRNRTPPPCRPSVNGGGPSLYHDRYFRGRAKFSAAKKVSFRKGSVEWCEADRLLPSGCGLGGRRWDWRVGTIAAATAAKVIEPDAHDIVPEQESTGSRRKRSCRSQQSSGSGRDRQPLSAREKILYRRNAATGR